MSIYLNCRFDDGERLAIEIGTIKGWHDFATWAKGENHLKVFATGEAQGSRHLREALQEAIPNAPNDSARAIAERLADVLPHEGHLTIADEPEDDDLET